MMVTYRHTEGHFHLPVTWEGPRTRTCAAGIQYVTNDNARSVSIDVLSVVFVVGSWYF